MESSRPYLVLGLDPGIASCGFCLLDMTNHKILEMGSHLFDAPQEAKTRVSLAVGRRNARSARRNNARTKARLKHCLELLQDYDLVPKDADRNWFQSQKGDKPVLKLRARGLDMPLTDRQFAQVLYSLCQQRGYIPHGEGKAGETDDDEGKKVLKAIAENKKDLGAGHFRTVGEMLNATGGISRNKRKREDGYSHCVLNSQIQDEVHKLFDAQRRLGNLKASEQLEKDYIECLTWEKETFDHDLRTYESQVGWCDYFPPHTHHRAARADISSELCSAYEKLGHLVIIKEDGTEQRLTIEQRNAYIDRIFRKNEKISYSTIIRDLDLSARDKFKGIDLEHYKGKEVYTPRAWRYLTKALSEQKGLLERMYTNRAFGDLICEALTFASTESSLKQRLEPLDLSAEETDALLQVSFTGNIFKGYGNRSLIALDLLLNTFETESVLTLYEAEVACRPFLDSDMTLYDMRIADKRERTDLLGPYSAFDDTCNNPVVLRSLGRMRRIVNAIIRIYGIPDEIHVEVGTDLKLSKKQKDEIDKKRKKNEKANETYAKIAAEILGITPDEVRGETIRKIALFEEQGCKDAYTGEPISLERLIKDVYTGDSISLKRLVRDNNYCQIDHILPYSRTGDDSRSNKVLVLAKNNQNKGNMTPYEWMHSGSRNAPDWDTYKSRVLELVKDPHKRSKLLKEQLDDAALQGFIKRNLNDTRYMSKAVRTYLEQSLKFPEDGPKQPVMVIAGGVTGTLRHFWGLNPKGSNKKNRKDDRHHAVDAAVIAACSAKAVKRVAEESSHGWESLHKKRRESRLANTQPWPTFAEDVIAYREHIVPTRMSNHGVTGRAFKDTLYHFEGFSDDKKHYPLLRAKGKTDKEGNVSIGKNDSAQIVDGMAFLRLWLDPAAKGRGGKIGKWYAEPVYFADIPALMNGRYEPKACPGGMPRTSWQVVPSSALIAEPIVLHSNDVIMVNDHIGRFSKFHIKNCALDGTKGLLDGEVIGKEFPSGIRSWDATTQVHVLQEDCLGHCYDNIILNPEDSTFTLRDQEEA